MKAKFTFSDCWDGMEVQFSRDTELEFVPFISMQFNFKPDLFELFVDTVIWHHNEGVLVVGFEYPHHDSKEAFVKAVRKMINQNQWQYQANKKAAEIIDMILKESTNP